MSHYREAQARRPKRNRHKARPLRRKGRLLHQPSHLAVVREQCQEHEPGIRQHELHTMAQVFYLDGNASVLRAEGLKMTYNKSGVHDRSTGEGYISLRSSMLNTRHFELRTQVETDALGPWSWIINCGAGLEY